MSLASGTISIQPVNKPLFAHIQYLHRKPLLVLLIVLMVGLGSILYWHIRDTLDTFSIK